MTIPKGKNGNFRIGGDPVTNQADGAKLVPSCEGARKMIHFKSVLIGFGTVLLGTPIALIIWAIWRSFQAGDTVSFSPMGLATHLAHSSGFWVLIIGLFAAGFVPTVFFAKR